jgi:hypothetical protein
MIEQGVCDEGGMGGICAGVLAGGAPSITNTLASPCYVLDQLLNITPLVAMV